MNAWNKIFSYQLSFDYQNLVFLLKSRLQFDNLLDADFNLIMIVEN